MPEQPGTKTRADKAVLLTYRRTATIEHNRSLMQGKYRMGSKRTGAYGEQIAADFLRHKGYTVLATNWSCTRGELDIIAQDGETLVFVEVKTRRASDPSDAFLGLTPAKRQRLIASAWQYVASQRPDNPAWRIDVVGVALPHSGPPLIEHVEDALDW